MKTGEAKAALDALAVISHGGERVPQKFAYAAIRNKGKLTELVQAYELSLQSLKQELGKKDNGVLVPGPKGELVLFELGEDGKVLWDHRAEFEKAHIDLLTEDLGEITLYGVSIAEFPKEIPLGVLEALMPMVLEEIVPAKEPENAAEKPT